MWLLFAAILGICGMAFVIGFGVGTQHCIGKFEKEIEELRRRSREEVERIGRQH